MTQATPSGPRGGASGDPLRARPAFVHRKVDELETRFGGVVGLVRKDLGISAFGIQLFRMPPSARGPAHDELASGQEELYIHLGGGGELEVAGERVQFDDGSLVFVAPGVRRQVIAGPEGVRYLCIGAVPGRAYEPPQKFA